MTYTSLDVERKKSWQKYRRIICERDAQVNKEFPWRCILFRKNLCKVGFTLEEYISNSHLLHFSKEHCMFVTAWFFESFLEKDVRDISSSNIFIKICCYFKSKWLCKSSNIKPLFCSMLNIIVFCHIFSLGLSESIQCIIKRDFTEMKSATKFIDSHEIWFSNNANFGTKSAYLISWNGFYNTQNKSLSDWNIKICKSAFKNCFESINTRLSRSKASRYYNTLFEKFSILIKPFLIKIIFSYFTIWKS